MFVAARFNRETPAEMPAAVAAAASMLLFFCMTLCITDLRFMFSNENFRWIAGKPAVLEAQHTVPLNIKSRFTGYASNIHVLLILSFLRQMGVLFFSFKGKNTDLQPCICDDFLGPLTTNRRTWRGRDHDNFVSIFLLSNFRAPSLNMNTRSADRSRKFGKAYRQLKSQFEEDLYFMHFAHPNFQTDARVTALYTSEFAFSTIIFSVASLCRRCRSCS